jgi:outer membrane protein TolC
LLPALPLISLLAAAPACGPLDFDGAVAVAAENADEIAIQKAELAVAQADLAIARAARFVPSATLTFLTGPVPEARGNILDSPNTNRSLRGLRPFFRTDVDVVQPIFTWGRFDAARDAAAAGVKARDLQVGDKMAELKVRIAQLFWGENLARRLLAIAADVEKSLADVDKKLDELLKQGDESVKPADRYRLDVYKATLRKRKAEAQKGLELAHGGLAATMGFRADEVTLRELALPLEAGDVPDARSAVEEAERQRPDLRALDQAIAARDGEVRAAHAAMLPQIFVGGNFSWAYAPNRTPQFNPWIQDTFNHVGGGVALGFKQDLALPLLITQANKASAEREMLERQRDGLARLVEQQVGAAVSEVRAARERLLAAMAALTSGKSWFRSAGLDFEAGVGEPKDVLEAYAGYVELQVDQQQAAYDLLVTRAKLDQVTGVPARAGASPCARGMP